MCLIIKYEKLLKKCNEIWKKIKKCIKSQKNGGDQVLNNKYVKTKTKFYNNKNKNKFL